MPLCEHKGRNLPIQKNKVEKFKRNFWKVLIGMININKISSIENEEKYTNKKNFFKSLTTFWFTLYLIII